MPLSRLALRPAAFTSPLSTAAVALRSDDFKWVNSNIWLMGAQEEREVRFWLEQPMLSLRGRLLLHVKRERAVGIVCQRLVPCAKRVALEIVRAKTEDVVLAGEMQ